MNQNERKTHLSKYLYRVDGITRKSEEDLMESLLKQAGVLSFDRVVIESLGLYHTFDRMEDACDLFEALVHNGHNADLFVGYVMNDGKVFVCDRSRGFNPVYSFELFNDSTPYQVRHRDDEGTFLGKRMDTYSMITSKPWKKYRRR